MAPEPVSHSWQRIDSWLRDCAPGRYHALPPPATRGQVVAAEQRLGLRLPEQLTDSLLCHDGSAPWLLPPVYTLLGTEAIVEHQRLQAHLENETRAEYLAHDIPLEIDGQYARWHPGWIPCASDDGGGYLVVDTQPGVQQGRVGTRDELGQSEFPPGRIWTSLAEVLQAVANALENNEPLNGYKRIIEDDDLRWDADE
ncbi:SMI1/KNR4 family protein [Streptomyces sp. NPDC050147]|uniref:SMI1/KNR4 family protein n=1 Tax=Streptomyces sp. NPDC050147 TaxID=3155513 RepID=UPI003430A021